MVTLGVAVGVTALWALTRNSVPVMSVQAGTFLHRVRAEGCLRATKATPISAPMEAQEGLKIAWLAPDGAAVRADDVVVKFDPTELETTLADGRTERALAESRIAGKRAESDAAVRNLDRDAIVAGRELEHARDFRSSDPLLFSRNQIIESEIDEKLALGRKENAAAVKKVRQELSSADLDLLEIERRQAEQKIARAEKGLESLEVRAPHDGILVHRKNWRGLAAQVGDLVWPGDPIAEIPQSAEMEAEVFVLEADAGGLRTGLESQVTIEAHPGAAFTAVVDKVDQLAKPRIPRVPVQYFAVVLRFARTDTAVMKPGMRVAAELTLEKKGAAISIPRVAVFDKDGKKVAYRREGRRFFPVVIQVGSTAIGRVVVESGLSAGDVIALADPTRSPGTGTEAAGEGEPPNNSSGGVPGGMMR
ncbi:MAG: efflux RND transporter periplasmic adaptor subunit [Acidobacteria bacterium]|nr:efflux RND transporter periplasmic adaptor subunit [Acidobacteriota bacterium]